MPKPHSGEDGSLRQRPLPSVDMALLPHELRALRVRQLLLAIFAVVVVSAVGVLAFGRGLLAEFARGNTAGAAAPAIQPPSAAANAAGGPSSEGPNAAQPALGITSADDPQRSGEPGDARPNTDTPAAAASLEAAPPVNGPLTRVVRPFGQARGFRDALTKAGATGAEADALITALDKIVDFRHGQPDHELAFERDASGVLHGFEYRASVTERYRAERSGAKFVGSRVKIDVERRRVAKGGYVADSLGRALEAQGLKNNLSGVFMEAFEGKLDFKKDAREGDSFRVILEEEYVEGQLLGYGKVQAVQYSGARAGDAMAFWYETEPGIGDFYDEHGRALHGGWLRTPVRYDHISSPYNLRRRHPILKRIVPHQGIDYAAPPGTSVWAAAEGVVTFVGPRGANGNLVALKHTGGYESFYAHLLRINRGITRGTRVKQRQPIGAVGSTGRSTGPHLHFGLKRNGRFLDPATQLNGPGKPLPESQLPKFKRQMAQWKQALAAIPLAAAPSPAAEAAPPPAETDQDVPAEDPIDL